MRADEFLRACEQLPFDGIDRMTAGGGLVVVAPHPDDESLGCGGLIATASATGVAVQVVIVSDGAGSHPKSRLYPPDRLRTLRRAEVIEAAEALGVGPDRLVFLDLPDTQVPSTGADADRAVAAIENAAAACGASAICVTWAHDPHCDHQAAAVLAAAACRAGPRRLWSYPIWGWTLPDLHDVGEGPSGFRLDVTPHLDAKRQAIAAHRSQTTDLITDDEDGFRLEPEFIARFLKPYEIYVQVPR